MKSPWEWNEEDLLTFVKASTKESIVLDFKRSDALLNTDRNKDEISKDVSAFANSAGGTLIYGIVENGHVAEALDKGSNPQVITKEWLEQVINSRIQRRIDGVRINQVELTRTNPGNVAYVVYIPMSMRAPHQASDKRFYKRFNFESVPMEEYEIRDVSRRMSVPDLRIHMRTNTSKLIYRIDNPDAGPLWSDPIRLICTLANDGEVAQYAIIHLPIDTQLEIIKAGEMSIKKSSLLMIGDKKIPVTILSQNWAIPGKFPIFQGVNFKLTDSDLEIAIPFTKETEKKHYLLGCEIQAPGMTPRRGYWILSAIKEELTLSAPLSDQEIAESKLLQWQA